MDQAEFYSEEERLDYIQQKLDFVSDFYAYSQEVSDFNIPWSEWVSLQSPLASSRANRSPSQQDLNLVDALQCGYEIGVCVKRDKDGNCIEVYAEANDGHGNYSSFDYKNRNGENEITWKAGNNKDSDRGHKRRRN
jgi:hypothetical protein